MWISFDVSYSISWVEDKSHSCIIKNFMRFFDLPYIGREARYYILFRYIMGSPIYTVDIYYIHHPLCPYTCG